MPRATYFTYGLSKPVGVAISADGSFALVADCNRIGRIDLITGWVSFPYGSLPGPRSIAISPDDSFALVACYYIKSGVVYQNVARIDLANRTITFPFAPEGAFPHMPHGIAISSDGSFALVTGGLNDGVKRIDILGGEITTIPYSSRQLCAEGISISSDSSFALVANSDDRRIGRIDLKSEAVDLPYEATIERLPRVTRGTFMEATDVAISSDDSFALVASESTLGRIDLKTGAVSFPFSGGDHRSVAIAVDCSFALVCHNQCSTVEMIDLLTPIARRALELGKVGVVENSFSADLTAMLEVGMDSNVQILAGDMKVMANSLVLKSRSPVFKAMLEGPMREATTQTITIEGFEEGTISQLLRFMNTDCVEASVLENWTQTLNLLHAAHQYQVKRLIGICAEMLGLSLDVENVAHVYRAAHRLRISLLQEECLGFIVGHLSEVQASDAFKELKQHEPGLLAHILETIAPPAKRVRRD